MDILAGIVTYNPSIELLKKNIEAVLSQVSCLLIVDNNSINLDDIKKIKYDNIHLIENDSNQGIAFALNQEFDFALKNQFKWVLTLDQDTIIPDNMLSKYKSYIDFDKVGMLTCRIQDRNLSFQNTQCEDKYEFDYVQDCITSGSMLSVEAWKKVKGFCEDMFIDSVDHDICLSLLDYGFKIIRINNVVLDHAIGKSINVVFCGKQYQLYNESPLRNYYQFRNSIYLLKRHKKKVLKSYKYGMFGFIFSRINRAFLICKYEKQSLYKLRMIVKGIWHGIIGKYGKYQS